MKRIIAVLLVVVCIVSLAGCKDKDAETAKEKAIELVSNVYSVQNEMLEDLGGFSLATQSTPTINKVEKVGAGRYVVTGNITGIHMKETVSKAWTASWNLTMVKNSSGEFEVASSPKPDYGTWEYLE